MYGLVLMTAMTTTPNAPEFNGYFRDLFSGQLRRVLRYRPRRGTVATGGCGGSYYPAGCSGSFYAGCNGCNGDTFLNRVRRWFDRGDCCGGVGSGYGCGCPARSGLLVLRLDGAYSCFGGPAVSYTPVLNGGQSCYGGPIPVRAAADLRPPVPVDVPGQRPRRRRSRTRRRKRRPG